jgi:hypothetical protein
VGGVSKIVFPVDCSRWVRRVSCRVAAHETDSLDDCGGGVREERTRSTHRNQYRSPKPEPTKAKATAGVKLWEFETGPIVHSSPAIGSDGTVYVGSDDKKLYAINGKSGVKLWEFETGSYVYSSPAIGSDGTVYVGSNDNKLYAIKSDSKGLAKSPWPMRGQNAEHTGRAPAK